jgi:hypothetical protein
MGETPWLAGSPINSNPHINHVLHILEQIIEVLIRHLEGHVSNEEGLGRWVPWDSGAGGIAFLQDGHVLLGVGYGDSAAFEELLVFGFDGGGGGGDGGEFDVAESVLS